MLIAGLGLVFVALNFLVGPQAHIPPDWMKIRLIMLLDWARPCAPDARLAGRRPAG